VYNDNNTFTMPRTVADQRKPIGNFRPSRPKRYRPRYYSWKDGYHTIPSVMWPRGYAHGLKYHSQSYGGKEVDDSLECLCWKLKLALQKALYRRNKSFAWEKTDVAPEFEFAKQALRSYIKRCELNELPPIKVQEENVNVSCLIAKDTNINDTVKSDVTWSCDSLYAHQSNKPT
jgi:hypothetical protein